ncbi:MAG: DegV family protein [Firmicutes bacterium]|nr:DegV family protein [Bacillota bacterium]
MRTAVVTDTNSSMSVQEGKDRGIFVIPMPVIIDGEVFHEGENVSFDEVFRAMADDKDVSTSQPSPGDVTDLWDSVLADGYDELVYIPMTSGLSGSCYSAQMLAEDYGGKVRVVDNHRISLTLYESVLDAKQMADDGKSAGEIKAELEDKAYDATIYITVDSLKYLMKSGRITRTAAALASLLRIRPVLTIQGEKLDAFAKVRGVMAAQKRMLEGTYQDIQKYRDLPKENVLVGAAGTLLNKEDIERWGEKIKAAFPGHPFLYHPLSCSIACHTGPNAFATGFVCMNRRV